MKKTLIALAAVAATGAFAQSVTLSGTFDPSLAIQKVTYGNGNSVSQNFLASSRRGTSQITFTGTEDLGGGMTASFRMENDFHAGLKTDQTGGTQSVSSAAAGGVNIGSGGGDIFVGLDGGFGTFRLGSPNTPSLGVQAGRDPFGTKQGSGFGATKGTGRVRYNHSLYYSTPSFGGFSANAVYSLGTTADANPATAIAESGKIVDLGLNYAAGQLRAGVTMFTQSKTAGQAADNAQTNFFVQFDVLSNLTAYLGGHRETSVTNAETAGSNIGVKYNVTPALSLLANMGNLKDKTNAVALNRKVLGLGVDYALSKRTTAYVRYDTFSNDNVAANAQSKVDTTLFGLMHNF